MGHSVPQQTAAVTVSVLMSVRNGLPYIRKTVASVIAQGFTDWEFIIVDNASTDGSAEVIEEIANREPRIALHRNPVDLGHSGGLNKGLEYCRGPWVARIDADDIAMPNRLERQLAFLRENPDVQVASCLAYYIDGKGRRVGKTTHELTSREAFRRYVERNLAIGILHPGAIMNRALLMKVGGYRGAFDPANDIDLWGRLADVGAIILVQPEYLMAYRVHSGSISGQAYAANRLKYQWARDCMRARRSGNSEPTWEAYVEQRRNASYWKRLQRWRKTSARKLYRQSAQDFLSSRIFRAALEIGAATLLQPSYSIPRLRGQWPK